MDVKRLRYKVHDRLDEVELKAVLQHALQGGGNNTTTPGNVVIWDDFGDQILVHLDSVIVKLLPRYIVISVDFESDQTGRAPLIVTFALGSTRDSAGLLATTDEIPRGNSILAARWGRILQETLWAALMGLVQQHAQERGKVPLHIHILDGHLRLAAAPPLSLGDASGSLSSVFSAILSSKAGT